MSNLLFEENPPDPDKVTRTWRVLAKMDRAPLGTVSWWTHWRRYTFFPDHARLFDADCLLEISNFLTGQTLSQQEDQKRRRAEKEAGDA